MPKPVIEQVGSRTCGCVDCLIDYPPSTYGPRPAQSACQGPWYVRYLNDRKQRSKRFQTRQDAHQFAAEVPRNAA
ncbi:hypothetical protein [Streptomyces scabiei]|uniref:hypothetical protein n=1 Tax=Streptomyces scabiei TaxID=1930 RepID=UPI0004E64268|nr:hypothetical protein [Streptomyces scabiei]KFG08137.1 hypothetical protein IQ61_15525 [Streptomyces scabiei]MDX3681414.1 hypothetical protein [Streptomyces scabiei]